MSERQDGLREDMRFRILRQLEETPDISQRELASIVGVSLGRLNYTLSALVDVGLVKLANFNASPQKSRYAYVLTPRGLSEKTALTRRFLRRKREEYAALKAEIAALEKEVETGRPIGTPRG
jgi:EPS-associated MarR family transcriptional regulator